MCGQYAGWVVGRNATGASGERGGKLPCIPCMCNSLEEAKISSMDVCSAAASLADQEPSWH